MKNKMQFVGILALLFAFAAVCAWGDPFSGNGSAANPFVVYEGVSYTLPGAVAAGDVVICEGSGPCLDGNGNLIPGADSDVVDFADTTALGSGNLAEAYCISSCDADDVPFPGGASALSIFSTMVTEGAAVNGIPETSFEAGNDHYLFIDRAPHAVTPEAAGLVLLGSGLLIIGLIGRRRTSRSCAGRWIE